MIHGISLAIPGNYSEECPVLTKWGECLGGKGGKSLGMSKKSTYAAFLRDSLAINEGIAKISIVIIMIYAHTIIIPPRARH